MRVLIDAQLPPALADWFKAKGLEADHTVALFGAEASDKAIVSAASRRTGISSISSSKDNRSFSG